MNRLECHDCPLQLACWSGALELYGCQQCTYVYVYSSKLIERACDAVDGASKWEDWIDLVPCASFYWHTEEHESSFKGVTASPKEYKEWKKTKRRHWGPKPILCPHCQPTEFIGIPVREWNADGKTCETYLYDRHEQRVYRMS